MAFSEQTQSLRTSFKDVWCNENVLQALDVTVCFCTYQLSVLWLCPRILQAKKPRRLLSRIPISKFPFIAKRLKKTAIYLSITLEHRLWKISLRVKMASQLLSLCLLELGVLNVLFFAAWGKCSLWYIRHRYAAAQGWYIWGWSIPLTALMMFLKFIGLSMVQTAYE